MSVLSFEYIVSRTVLLRLPLYLMHKEVYMEFIKEYKEVCMEFWTNFCLRLEQLLILEYSTIPSPSRVGALLPIVDVLSIN